ncbi:MAG: NUDIX domain-containing protein [Bacteroidota bacterium]
MMQRKKEPFYGYWGFIGGKIKFDQYILECAKAELYEEAGLRCDLTLKGLFSSKTYHGTTIAYNHQLFIIMGKNPRGKLVGKTREGECKWISLPDVSSLQNFPNVKYSLQIAKSKRFRWIEADRMQKDDVFIGMKEYKNQLV